MWNPVKIEFRNLFSHKDSSYVFKNNKCVVIFGENKSDRSLENNGAGKTTLFEAVCIALTNESLRNIKKENFINRDADSCFISMELNNAILRMTLRIERQFFRGSKPVNVKIFENGIQNTQVVSVADANKRVLELIGISREDLLKYFIISQDNHYTFFTASDTEKKEIMNRITSADMINPAIEELAIRKTKKQTEYNLITSELDKLSGKRETLAEQRQELLEADNSDVEIKELKEKISICEENISQNDLMIKKDCDFIKQENERLNGIQIPDVSNLRNERKKNRNALDELESEKSDSVRIKKNLENELADTLKCPNCGHEYIQSDLGLSKEDAERLLSENEKELKKIEKKIESLKTLIKEQGERISKAEEAEEEMNDIKMSIRKRERGMSNRQSENEDYRKKIEKCKSKIDELKNFKGDNSAIIAIDSKIEECDREISEKQKSLKPVQEEIDMIKYWQFYMGKNGFMTYLANKSVKIIEGITNSYLRKFGVDISVLINGFKILKSGEVREKIDIFVSNDGVTAENFMAKSGGERGRVTLAGVLGIQHLINLSTNGGGLNLLLLDEVFPGVDSLGQEKMINTLNELGSTIMMITQNVGEGFNNENTLRVVKENGVSHYI